MGTIDIRPMTLEDAAAVAGVIIAAGEQLDREAGRSPRSRTDAQHEQFLRGLRRFVERDPEGAWVAADGGTVVGISTAIRRESFWGLSLLFVDPEHQSVGVGRALLEAALECGAGAEVLMILSSTDPRAIRRYSRAGLQIHPGVKVRGTVDPSAIPEALRSRPGDANDLDLVASVDSGLRGSRAEDVEYLLSEGAGLQVIDDQAARGYIVHRDKRLWMLGATDDFTAALLLWSYMADAGEVELWGLTARQDWAVKVALAARLEVVPGGPLFLSGREHPPGPWLPSGWYF